MVVRWYILYLWVLVPFSQFFFCHLHYNVFERGCEAILGGKPKIAQNCLTSAFKYVIMQMIKVNLEKGYNKGEGKGKSFSTFLFSGFHFLLSSFPTTSLPQRPGLSLLSIWGSLFLAEKITCSTLATLIKPKTKRNRHHPTMLNTTLLHDVA